MHHPLVCLVPGVSVSEAEATRLEIRRLLLRVAWSECQSLTS
jgi:hypothetical protein